MEERWCKGGLRQMMVTDFWKRYGILSEPSDEFVDHAAHFLYEAEWRLGRFTGTTMEEVNEFIQEAGRESS